MEEFTFSVSDVLDYLGVQHARSGSRDTEDVVCPICKGKKLHVVYSKNLARCNKCGAGGGMLQLASDVLGISRPEAARLIAKSTGRFQEKSEERTSSRNIAKSEDEINSDFAKHKAVTADIEIRDRTYAMYLDMLSLSETHLNDLRKRGLNDIQIQKFGYKSVPLIGKETYPKRLQEQDALLRGVPGFYCKNYVWKANIGWIHGFYIPVKDIEGRILGLQIRKDSCTDSKKYIWSSSWSDNFLMDQGSNLEGIPKFHHVGFPKDGDIPVIGLTEGPLKGDIAHSLGYKYPIIALCGLSNQLGLYDELLWLKETRGLCEVQDLTDMDKFKPDEMQEDGTVKINYVRRWCDQISSNIETLGIRCQRFRWDIRYKGIDDYLLVKNWKKEEQKSHEREGKL